jgi:hypothetical protein
MKSESTVAGSAAVTSSSTARARQHRQRLRNDCTRLDITIGTDVAGKLKAIAKQQSVPLWQVVEKAIEALATETDGVGNA